MADKDKERAETAGQMYAAIGVGLVCIVIGLPLWWKTTEIYRVNLPYGEINELATSKMEYRVDFTVVIFDETIGKVDVARFSDSLQQKLSTDSKDSRLSSVYSGNVRHAFEEEKQAYDRAKTVTDLDDSLDAQKLLHENGKYTFALLPKSSKMLKENVVGWRRAAFLTIDPDLPSLLPSLLHILQDVYVNEEAMLKSFQSATSATHDKADKKSMRSVRSHPGYEVTFTLLNPQPDILQVTWDMEGAVERYLKPLLNGFEEFTDISVKSQYLHYTRLHIKPKKADNESYLVMEDLPHIINPIEAHLGSHVSNFPSLNFILYIPSRDQSPLYLYNDQGTRAATNAFLSPQWGGLVVYNVDSPQDVPLPAPVTVNMVPIMETFISQLRLLLGIDVPVSNQGVQIIPPGNIAVAEREIDSWLRSRTLENIATATTTLKSLIQLLEEVGNIVINDDIGREVERAVASIKKSQGFLSGGRLKDAYLTSRDAIISSEKAFFDPSLLELLYFPEDQKFAIYIPLFLPISIPVLMSLAKAYKWIRAKDDKAKTE